MKARVLLPLFVFALGFLAAGPLLLAQAPAPDRGDLVATINVPSGLDAKAVRDVVVNTFLARSWNLQGESEGVVVAHLQHRGYDSTITAAYDTAAIRLYSNSWKVNKEGKRLKREHPAGWIANLKKDFPKRLAQKAFGAG